MVACLVLAKLQETTKGVHWLFNAKPSSCVVSSGLLS